MEPIPQGEVKAWNALIKETREVVLSRDTSVFDLIILAGKVEAKHGEGRIGRWAEEACVGAAAAKQYRWLASKGVDVEFVEKWARSKGNPKGLSYTIVREIAQFCGSLKSIYALEYLQWAVEHHASAIGMRGYMMESTAPDQHKEEAAQSIKMALMDKQEHEGFSDGIRYALEMLVEENPELEDEVLGTVITKAEDIEALKIAAGIKTDVEGNMVEKARRNLNKLKLFRKWLRENKKDLSESIAYGHEFSELLKDYGKYIVQEASVLAETDIPLVRVDESKVEAMDITPPKAVRGLAGADPVSKNPKKTPTKVSAPVKKAPAKKTAPAKKSPAKKAPAKKAPAKVKAKT